MTLPVTIIDNDSAVDFIRFRKMILTVTDSVRTLVYSATLRVMFISTNLIFFKTIYKWETFDSL